MSSASPARPAWPGMLLVLIAGWAHAFSMAWPFATQWATAEAASSTWLGLAYGQAWGGLQVASLAVLFGQLQGSRSAGQAMRLAWLFALAMLAGTFWWLFTSMHRYGGLPAPLAVLAVLILAGLLALYYAAAAGVYVRFAPASALGRVLLFAGLWLLAELARVALFTGFPWGEGGYAHINGWAGPLAPWVGVHGLTWLAAAVAAGLAIALMKALNFRNEAAAAKRAGVAGLALTTAALLLAGLPPLAGLDIGTYPQPVADHASAAGPAPVAAPLTEAIATGAEAGTGTGTGTGTATTGSISASVSAAPTPLAGNAQRATPQNAAIARPLLARPPLSVTLVQGNIAQDLKFQPGTGVADALQFYGEQLRNAQTDLIVLPETALPLLPNQLPEGYLARLQARYSSGTQAALIGMPLVDADGYSNSVVGLKPGAAPYRYDKHHLVPFGEFIPPFFQWFIRLMDIPLGDFKRGALGQAAFEWRGERIAPNICYEDLFGEELGRSFKDPTQAPTLLVNVSNIAWFGNSVAIDQHLQISRMRSLEFARPMLRATNTGATVVINPQGEVTHSLPRHTRGTLQAEVWGVDGLTPYARWVSHLGLWPWWLLGGLTLAAALLARRLRPSLGAAA